MWANKYCLLDNSAVILLIRVYVGKERFPHSVGSFLAVQLSLALWAVSGKRNDKLCP